MAMEDLPWDSMAFPIDFPIRNKSMTSGSHQLGLRAGGPATVVVAVHGLSVDVDRLDRKG